MDEHARFGGVVPEVASRAHLQAMVPTVRRALRDAGVAPADVDAVAVTAGPGLAGALLVGVAAAKAYAAAWDVPLYGVNHLAAHVAADTSEHGPLPDLRWRCWSPAGTPLLQVRLAGGADCTELGATSTTPPGRRSTRSRGCSGWASPAARSSTGPARRATRAAFASPAA